MKYKDEDGDLITLFDSADLAVAISYSRVLKLTLFVNGEISVGGKPASAIDNTHLIKELRGIRNRITEILDSLCDETNINGGNAPIGKHVEAIDEAEVLGASSNQLSGMKLESKEFDPLQKPIGTLHILRKDLYNTKLNFSRDFFFVKTKKNIFQHYILTKFSCCSLKFLVHKEKCTKNS